MKKNIKKLKLEGKVLTREQMKSAMGGLNKVDNCTCIVNDALTCIFSGCVYSSGNGTCNHL